MCFLVQDGTLTSQRLIHHSVAECYEWVPDATVCACVCVGGEERERVRIQKVQREIAGFPSSSKGRPHQVKSGNGWHVILFTSPNLPQVELRFSTKVRPHPRKQSDTHIDMLIFNKNKREGKEKGTHEEQSKCLYLNKKTDQKPVCVRIHAAIEARKKRISWKRKQKAGEIFPNVTSEWTLHREVEVRKLHVSQVC